MPNYKVNGSRVVVYHERCVESVGFVVTASSRDEAEAVVRHLDEVDGSLADELDWDDDPGPEVVNADFLESSYELGAETDDPADLTADEVLGEEGGG